MQMQPQSLFSNHLLDTLNPDQKEAVLAEGIVRVIAAPGSGKTRTLTYRTAYLIAVKGIAPTHILALTFTKKAANEMKQRLNQLIGTQKTKNLWCYTFHAFCYKILKAEGIAFKLLEEKRRLLLLRHCLTTHQAELTLKETSQFISLAKNNLRLPADFANEAYLSPVIAEKLAIYALYEEKKKEEGVFDFDDLQIQAWQLFKNRPEILEKYRQKFIHILVDEVQDVNKVQFELLRLLVPPQNNLFVVGDDAQAIYRFRGAVPQYILQFEQLFPQAKTIKLEQNYRSTRNIVMLSNRLMQHSQCKTEKNIWTTNKEGKPPQIISALNREEEALKVIKHIKALIKKGVSPQNIAVLYRTNYQSRPLEDACIHTGVPYTIIGSTGFYLRKEVKDMTAYLKLIADLGSDEAFLEIFNIPPRDLGFLVPILKEKSIETGKSLFHCLPLINYPSADTRKRAERFYGMIKKLHEIYKQQIYNLGQMVREIRRYTNYDAYLARRKGTPDEFRVETIDELCMSLARFKDVGKFLAYLQIAQQEGRKRRGRRINLLTIHKAKGLEWPVVFLAGCSLQLLPHYKVHDIEEERRLCYVAITRAREQLFISYAGRPSPFLKEMMG